MAASVAFSVFVSLLLIAMPPTSEQRSCADNDVHNFTDGTCVYVQYLNNGRTLLDRTEMAGTCQNIHPFGTRSAWKLPTLDSLKRQSELYKILRSIDATKKWVFWIRLKWKDGEIQTEDANNLDRWRVPANWQWGDGPLLTQTWNGDYYPWANEQPDNAEYRLSSNPGMNDVESCVIAGINAGSLASFEWFDVKCDLDNASALARDPLDSNVPICHHVPHDEAVRLHTETTPSETNDTEWRWAALGLGIAFMVAVFAGIIGILCVKRRRGSASSAIFAITPSRRRRSDSGTGNSSELSTGLCASSTSVIRKGNGRQLENSLEASGEFENDTRSRKQIPKKKYRGNFKKAANSTVESSSPKSTDLLKS